MHPMIASLGESQFEKMLDCFPDSYNAGFVSNYKPVAMTLLWLQHKHEFKILPDQVKDWLVFAHNEWRRGLSLKESCISAVVIYAIYEINQQVGKE